MDKALEEMGKLAERIGQTVAALWPHAVRYVTIEAAVQISLGALACGLAVNGCKRSWARATVLDARCRGDGEGWHILAFVLGASSILAAVTAASAIPQLLEPVGCLAARYLR